jgi:hypothetical protein
MKALFCIITLVSLVSMPAFGNSNEADIIMQTRFNKDWSQTFLNHIRQSVIQNGMQDPYSMTVEEPLIFDLGPKLVDFSKEGQNWYKLLLQFLKIDMMKSDFRLVMDKFRYELDDLDVEIQPQTRNNEMTWRMKHNVNGIAFGSDRIALEISLHSVTGTPIVFSVELLGAELVINDLTVPLEALWKSSLKEDLFKITLEKIDLREAMKVLHKNSDNVILNIEDIIVPTLEIRVGNRSIRLDQEKFRHFIFSRKDELKKFILDIIVLRNLDVFEDPTGDDDLVFDFPRNFFAESTEANMSVGMRIDGIIATNNQARARINGALCIPLEAYDYATCMESAPVNPRANREGRDYEASLRKIFQDLERSQADIILSISEPFINQALTASIKSGILTEAFDDGEISLGEGGVLLRIDREGDVFHGYFHLNNKISGMSRRLTGRSSITFPIYIGLKIRMEQREDIPYLVIEVAEASAERELLLKGKPDIGMPANIATVPRFRNKVIQRVQDSVKKFQGNKLVELPLPFLTGTFFMKTRFVSDGFGRANALFKVEEKQRLK